MSDILTPDEIADGPTTKRIKYDHGGGRMYLDVESRDLILDTYNAGDTEFYQSALTDIDRLIASHRALAAERDRLEFRVTMLKEDKEQVLKNNTRFQSVIVELEAQVRELTGVLEEMRDCDEGMGSHCARLLAETLADAELSVIKPRNKALESFRERAVRVIRAFIDERQTTLVLLPSFKTELVSLVESLPLEPEQEEKL